MSKYIFYPVLTVISLLFISGDLRSQEGITATLNTPANAGIFSENCSGPYSLIIERAPGNTDTTVIDLTFLGTAEVDVDYAFPPGTFPLQLLPDEDVAVIPVTVTDDGTPEGLEDFLWVITYVAGTNSGTLSIASGITDEYSVEIQSTGDTIQWCRFVPLQLSAISEANISWSPTPAFETPTGSEVTARPFLSGWYYATVGSEACGARDSVYLDLAIADIVGPDTLFICLDGEGVILQGTLQGLATGFEWVPSDTTLSDPNILTPLANPLVTTTYILQSDFGVCLASDTVVVRVDSLPLDMHIDIAPLKAYYCAGEIVALFSPSFDSLDFPDLEFSWIPDNSTFLTSTDLLNAALELQDTTWYIRENINNACISRDSILINVVPSSVPLSVTDTVLCPGEMFTVTVLSNQVTNPEWTPADGLSCTQCLSPKVTVLGSPGSALLYTFSGMILDCPVGANLPIQIPPIQQLNITGDNVVCAGDMVPLTIGNPADLTGFSWSITHGNASLSCTSCPDPIVTVNASEVINVLLTATTSNPNFCGSQGFIQLVPGEQLQVTGPAIKACPGGTVVASTGNATFTDVRWDVLNGNLSLSCTNCENPVVTVITPGLLRFFAESPDPDVCRVSGSVSVSFFTEDEANLIVMPDPNVAPIGQGTNVSVMLAVNPLAPASVMWTINGVSIPATGTMISFNADKDQNTVTATFINSKGCEQTVTISIPTVPPSYMIPNAFTPDNGDDINDNFRIIINGNITVEKFLIFNRWGQKVYEANDDLQGWDGRFKNEPAPSDTYVYTATLRFPDGRIEVAKGDVILLK